MYGIAHGCFTEEADGMTTDSKGNQILNGADTNPKVRMLHNIKVVQSRKGWKYAHVEKAIADAKAGIVYDRS